MSTVISTLKQFLADPDAWDMFIEGPAGTGKTFSLIEILKYIQDYEGHYFDEDPDLEIVLCAHTHQACKVIRATLAKEHISLPIVVRTLHSFLRKMPTVNQKATDVDYLNSSIVTGEASCQLYLLCIDEFSIVGEEDKADIRALQDPEYEGFARFKILWLGDPYQLPPVRDKPAIKPYGDYHCVLSEQRRSSTGLSGPINQVLNMIQGKSPPGPLLETSAFHRWQTDLYDVYDNLKFENDSSTIALLAYTNRAVQEWNATIQGKEICEPGDLLFSATMHAEFKLEAKLTTVTSIDRFRDDPLHLGSKYKTLEFLLEWGAFDYYEVVDTEGNAFVYPVCFGTYNYKVMRDQLGKEAVAANRAVEKHAGKRIDIVTWCKANPLLPVSRARARAWRRYLTFKDTVHCFDFPHAFTIHKAQGSSFDYVLLDSTDLDMCRINNFDTYLRLWYVSLSRARKEVYANS